MLLGIGGWSSSGKDSLGAMLVENHGYTRYAFADSIREFLYTLNPPIDVREEPFSIGLWPIQRVVDRWGWERAKREVPIVRELLQEVGASARSLISEDVWVDLLFKQELPENAVITDVRFSNELAAIKKRGGMTVWVSRPGVIPVNNHASEVSLGSSDFNWIIENDGDFQDLANQAKILADTGFRSILAH